MEVTLSVTATKGITYMNRLGYLFGEGFRGIFKHGFMSFATVAILVACLIIMGSVGLVSVNVDALVKELENQNEVVAFVDENLDDESSRALLSAVQSIPNVASVEYVTREEAMENFMGNYDSTLMEGVDSSVFRNRFVIKLDDIAQMSATKQALESVDGIVKVNAHLDYAKSFITVRKIIRIVSLILIAMLTFVSFFIMSNTIKLATYSRREEIGIMKMVGASNSFIRMPFVIEGLILGLFGAMLAFFAQWGIYDVLAERIIHSTTGVYLTLVPFESVMKYILIFFLSIGGIVGMFGGISAIRNYLKV